MIKRAPAFQRDWLPTNGYYNQDTETAVNMLGEAVEQLGTESREAERAASKRIQEQGEEILELRAHITALTELLVERQLIDSQALAACLSSVQVQARPQASEEIALQTCKRCGKSVPAQQTQITASGTLCDSCWTQESMG